MPLASFLTQTNTKSLNSNPFNNRNESSDSEQKQQLISMKDLCPEDKQRIANLIKELAK